MSELEIIAQSYSEITLDGKVRKIGSITVGDWADFEQYIQQKRKKKILEMAKELYGDNIPPSVLDKALASPTKEELDEQQNNMAGVGFLLWRALKKYNPDMTLDEASAMIPLDRVSEILLAIMPDMVQEKKTV